MTPTKADLQLAKDMESIIKRLNHKERMGKDMCEQLHGDCYDCKTRIMIAYLNMWIETLTWEG